MLMSVSETPRSIMNFLRASARIPRLLRAFTVGSRGSSHPLYSPASMAFLRALVLKDPNWWILILPQWTVEGYSHPR